MVSFRSLAELRGYASNVRERAGALNPPPELQGLRDELVRISQAAVDASDCPLRVGFMGEVSAGKSLLLGALVGKPDLLPTSPHPTTGNVTELRFRRQSDVAQTTVENTRVRYLSSSELSDLEHELTEEMDDLARGGAVGANLAAALEGAQERGPGALRAWCQEAWVGKHPRLRKLIRAWVLTTEAREANTARLGEERDVSPDALRAALEIGYPMQSEAFPQLTDLRPPRKGLSPGPPSGQDVLRDELALASPVLDRVIIELSVPSRSWDLAQIQEHNEFVLLDFPGIGGGLSRARDLYLTRRGLQDVHTALVLVDSDCPGGSVPDEFYGFLRALGRTDEQLSELVVYCASRFDRLPVPQLPPGPGDDDRLTPDGLLSTPSAVPLRALLSSGHEPGISSMRAFISSVRAIDVGGLIPVPDEVPMALAGPASRVSAQAWSGIAAGLSRGGGPGRDLAEGLQEYVRDGGVDRVRSLIGEHLREHGLRHRLDIVDELVDEVDRLREELLADLRRSGANQAVPDPNRRVSRLLTELDTYRYRFVSSLRTLRDPGAVRLTTQQSVRDAVGQKAAELVVDWPEWAALFEAVQNDVIVPARVGSHEDQPDWASDLLRKYDAAPIEQAALPDKMKVFFVPFARTCETLRLISRAYAAEAMDRWSRERARDAAPLRGRVDELLTEEAVRRLTEEKLGGIRAAFDILFEPALIVGHLTDQFGVPLSASGLRGQGSADPATPQPLNEAELEKAYLTRFPLRTEQVPAWASDPPGDARARHLVRVLRLRSVLIEAAIHVALDDLDDLQNSIFLYLDRTYANRNFQLPSGSQRERFAAAVLGRSTDPTRPLLDPAEELAGLSRPPRSRARAGVR
jgi:hypothetical protein